MQYMGAHVIHENVQWLCNTWVSMQYISTFMQYMDTHALRGHICIAWASMYHRPHASHLHNARRYGWKWGHATRASEHMNIGIKEQIRTGHHRQDHFRSLLQHRQRLSAINEIMAMTEGEVSTQIADEHTKVEVCDRQLWKFAVHRRSMQCSMKGQGFVVEGKQLNRIMLDLPKCGRRTCPRTGFDWGCKLPELAHLMQQCRLYLIVENKVHDLPGPSLRTAPGGEQIMTAEQQTFLNDKFVQWTEGRSDHGNALVFSRMEMVSEEWNAKVGVKIDV